MPKKILYLGNKLSKSGSNITTIESLGCKLSDLGFTVKCYSSKKNKFLRLIEMHLAVIKHKNYDFLIIDTYSTSAFWFAFLTSRLALFYKIKFIPILHGGNLEKRLNKNPKLSNKFFSQAYVNVAPSKFMHDIFKANGYNNLKLIPNSIDIENYPFKQRAEIKPNLLWVRALDKIYNPMMAIKVFEILLKDFPQARLSMVGPKKDESFEICKDYANNHNLPVEFTGQLSKPEWLKHAKDFDLFMNTTTIDNTPVSVIEAMALGLPVISTNVGGLHYLIKNNENGKLVNSNAVHEMYNGISELILNPDLTSKISKNARKMVESFDWAIVKNRWEEILN
jgi:glycosyltransferase involved in cell wall biosynthesis